MTDREKLEAIQTFINHMMKREQEKFESSASSDLNEYCTKEDKIWSEGFYDGVRMIYSGLSLMMREILND